MGRAVLAIGPGGGLAQVSDRRGNLHQVAAGRCPGTGAARREEVLVVDYDERQQRYLVARAET